MTERLRILPLGGVGEIGKNMTVIEYGDRMVIVDVGLRFPGGDMPGIDLLLPDFDYVAERKDSIDAIVITHGHEDHICALPWLLRSIGTDAVPAIYGGALTIEMARSKLDEHKLSTGALEPLECTEHVKAGPFDIELIHLTHSIPDMCAVSVTTPAGRVLMTGDYKFDQTPVDGGPADMARLAQLADEGVLVLCGDSTNADREGFSPSESIVGPALEHLFEGCQGRIIVTSFASNIHRIQQVVDAAQLTGRKVSLIGRSMRKNTKIARALDHLDIPEGMLVAPREVSDFPDEKIVVISTGSQGEPLSALRRMAHHDHAQVELHPNDTIVFSATPVPGNERAVNETIDRLHQIGCRVVTAADAPVHASGHGYAEELKLMINLTKPRYVMPVHGDAKRLRLHADLAEAVGVGAERVFVGENGLPLDIDNGSAGFGPREKAGVILVDGMELGGPADAAVRDRRTIADDGLIVCVVSIDEQDGRLISDPEIVLRGVAIDEREFEVTAELVEAAIVACDRAAEQNEHDSEELRRRVHDSVSACANRTLRKRPLVVPVVVQS